MSFFPFSVLTVSGSGKCNSVLADFFPFGPNGSVGYSLGMKREEHFF